MWCSCPTNSFTELIRLVCIHYTLYIHCSKRFIRLLIVPCEFSFVTINPPGGQLAPWKLLPDSSFPCSDPPWTIISRITVRFRLFTVLTSFSLGSPSSNTFLLKHNSALTGLWLPWFNQFSVSNFFYKYLIIIENNILNFLLIKPVRINIFFKISCVVIFRRFCLTFGFSFSLSFFLLIVLFLQ